MIKSLIASLVVLFSLAASAQVVLLDAALYDGVAYGSSPGGPYTFSYVDGSYAQNGNPDVSSIATGSGINVSAGDVIIVIVQWEDEPARSVTSISDGTNSLTEYTEVNSTPTGYMNIAVWYKTGAAAVASAVFTATFDAPADYPKISAIVFSPSGGTTTLDISGTPNNSDESDLSATPTTGTFSTTGANNLVCGLAGIYTGGTWTPASFEVNGTTATDYEANTGQSIWCVDNIGALTSVDAGSQYSALRHWAATAISFKAE